MNSKWTFFWVGLICLIIPVSGMSWWIYVTQANPGDHYEMVEYFMKPIPDWVGNARYFTWIQVLFCAAAFLCFYQGLDEEGITRKMYVAMLSFTGVIGFWLLFSLM